jgi:MoxR-like ATPase
MPADILGTNMVLETPDGKRVFEFQRGPIFTQICLADEINRATPKTQSALLETMQEGTITVAGTRLRIEETVLRHGDSESHRAGGHLSVARGPVGPVLLQADRGLLQPRGTGDDRRANDARHHDPPEKVMDGSEIVRWQQLIREVILAEHVQDYIVRLVLATHPEGPFALPITNQYLRWGASPRGAQAMALAAKIRALLEGRYNVSFEDVRRVYCPRCGIV